jgi:PAS domain S-box-containing protein
MSVKTPWLIVLDPLLLVVLAAPLLYMLIVRPISNALDMSRRAEQNLQDSEQRFRGIFEEGPLGMAMVDKDFRAIMANATLCQMLGYTKEELTKLSFPDFTHPQDIEKDVCLARQIMGGEIPSYKIEKRFVKKNKEILSVALTASAIHDESGKFLCGLSMVEDITARKQVEKALRESGERYQSLLESMSDSVWVMDRDSRYVLVNAAAERSAGIPRQELIGKKAVDVFSNFGSSEFWMTISHVLQSGTPGKVTDKYVFDDGREGWYEMRVYPVPDGVLCMSIDITDRKRAEEALQRSTNLLNSIRDSQALFITHRDPTEVFDALLKTLVTMTDSEYGFLDEVSCDDNGGLSQASLATFGWDEDFRRLYEEFVSNNLELRDMKNPMGAPALTGELTIVNDALGDTHGRLPKADPPLRTFMGIPMYFGGELVGVAGVANREGGYDEEVAAFLEPLTSTCASIIGAVRNARKEHLFTEALHISERNLTITNRVAHVFLTAPDDEMYGEVLRVVLEASASPYGLFGHIGEDGDLVCPSMLGDAWEKCSISDKAILFPRKSWGGIWGRALMEGKSLYSNKPGSVPDGHIPISRSLVVPIIHHAEVIGILAVANKATNYVKADVQTLENIARYVAPVLSARLQRNREERMRARSEEQLRHSQKMEAVGQLAGGIAHDFNNLLQAIRGHIYLSLDALEPGATVRDDLELADVAAGKAARLTKQLLAFGRRQILQPQNLDLKDLVDGLLKMIRRVIGEHIQLDFRWGHELGLVHADPGQIELMLMNLCINARDAMPHGGALTIETQNVEIGSEYCATRSWAKPGRYVLLTVADTGCGMDERTREQIFEPFFTTKELGQGTGLGLASAYGIIKQHKGMIAARSEKGRGSTFEIYLPLVEGRLAPVVSAVKDGAARGTGTILVAEDDDMVRSLTVRVLGKAGYRVLAARDGREALRVFAEHDGEIDLALLDVVMPRLGGWGVFDLARKEHPGARFLFASGYSVDAVYTNRLVDEGLPLIQKPYQADDLLRKVRDVLDM